MRGKWARISAVYWRGYLADALEVGLCINPDEFEQNERKESPTTPTP